MIGNLTPLPSQKKKREKGKEKKGGGERESESKEEEESKQLWTTQQSQWFYFSSWDAWKPWLLLSLWAQGAPSFPTLTSAFFVGGLHSRAQGYSSSANFFTAERANKVSHNFLFLNRVMGLPPPPCFCFSAHSHGKKKKTWRLLEKENYLIKSRGSIRNLHGAKCAFGLFIFFPSTTWEVCIYSVHFVSREWKM